MPSDSGLTAAGSSTYASNTLHVGDGTWDSDRDTFLLPNLMGLNFATMQYNGMGNRFRDMPDYHKMICAHGILGTIAFLGLVPMSVLLVRYYSRWNPYWAFKLHVWCQVLTLFLSTVIFVLGWFAVGPKRSLSNPHHGIGLAIYVLVIFQFFWGYLVHRIERSRKSFHVPLKLVIHRWMGCTLALLGIIQIPLGLTLYGSPKVLFILFAIAVFTLFVAFFVLSYLYDNEGYPMGSEYDSRHSYVSGPSSAEDQHHDGNLGKWAAAGLAGAALAKLFRRRSQGGSESHSYDSQTSYMDEKVSDEGSRLGGWKKKLLELGALGGAAFLAKKIFSKKDNHDDGSQSGRYSRAHTRSDSMSEETMSRMEDGRRPEPTHRTPLNRPPSRPPSRPQSPGSAYLYSSAYTDPKPSHGAGNAFLGAGAFTAIKNLFTGRKGNAEQRRVEEMRRQEMEDERIARANSKRRYTGDGRYPRNRRDGSNTVTDITSTTESTRPPHGESTISPYPGGHGDGKNSDVPPAPPAHHDMPSRPGGSAPSSPVSSDGRRHAASTPHSLELKNDGHNVTLRRLTEEEAAANREARRRERRNSRRRTGSASSLSGNEGENYDRWRRVEELERQQQEQMQREQEAAAAPPSTVPPQSSYTYAPPRPHQPSRMGNLPPPPVPPPQPHPPSTLPYGSGSIASPGTFTGTEASGDYAGNRRRRRAERARARQERQQSVDFT